MSDWFGGTGSVAMLAAGNDLLMPGTDAQAKALLEAVASGRLSRAVLDTSVTRILELVARSPSFRGVERRGHPDLKGHAEVARRAAAEGMVLLRNERVGARAALPLGAQRAVALFGNTSFDPIAGGTGSGNVNRDYTSPSRRDSRRQGCEWTPRWPASTSAISWRSVPSFPPLGR